MADLVRRDHPDHIPLSNPVPSLPQSPHCFRTADPPDRPRRSRAKFTTEKRERVLGVRRQGACLRCRILKIQCSLENPCQSCLQSALKGSERKVLSFCYCVRTRFADVNIFDSSSRAEAVAAMQIETLMRAMADLLARIASPANFSLTSNPIAFNNTLVSWLTDPNFHLPNGSIVGLCCSSLLGLQFQEDAAAGTEGLITDFRRFLLATSLAHTSWRDGHKAISTRDLCSAGQISGYRLIKRLDRILTRQFLSRCSRESCQVLFLLVLGAVLGVGYSSSQLEDHSPQFPSAGMLSPEFQRSPTLWLAMKEHLCQMLAHHLIFLGSMLGIKLDTGMEQRIIDTAASRWNKAEEFVWADVTAGLGTSGPPQASSDRAEPRGIVKTEDRGEIPPAGEGSTKLPVRNHLLSPPPTAPPRLVSIPCPEARQFQPQTTEAWSENPKSYLSMFDDQNGSGRESATHGQATPPMAGPGPRLSPEPRLQRRGLELPQRREAKRRSIWVVRPFDAGPEEGLINVHARLRGSTGMESLRAFV